MVNCTYTSCVHTITNILSQNKSLEIFALFFCLFLYDVCQKYIVRNSKSNDKQKRKPTQQELQCTVTEGTTLLLHSAYSYSTDPKSTLLNLTEFHQYFVKRTVCIENKVEIVIYFEFVIIQGAA